MKYDFDQVIERRGTASLKWDTCAPDVLPMWVADMDFAVAEPIEQAMKERAAHPIYGYGEPPASYYESVCGWFQRRHGWDIRREWLSYSPGIVSALHFFYNCYLEPGEKVMMMDPVYYPFFAAAQRNNVTVEKSRLKIQDGKYRVDFADFEAKAADPRVKMFILCNPHNPGGRCWEKEELERMARICIDNGVLIISDEIHCDLTLNGNHYTPCASISPEITDHTVTCVAPSKTFNIAGLQTSCIVISNKELKDRYDTFLRSIGIMRPGVMGMAGFQAAYEKGGEWLDQLLVYLNGNLAFLKEYIAENLPFVRIMEPEATYLVWMDFREYGMEPEELHRKLLEEGKVWLDEGYLFGDSGNYYERINIACPRSVLKDALDRMKQVLVG